MQQSVAVLHLLPTLSLGGAERYVAALVEGARERSVRPVVVAMHRGGPILERLRAAAVPTEVLGIQRAPIRRPLAAWRDARGLVARVLAIAREQRIDLIQTHLPDADWLGLWSGRKLRVPVIVTCHNPTLVPQERREGEWRTRLRRALQRRLYRRAAALVAVGGAVEKELLALPGVARARVHRIPSGFAPRPPLDPLQRDELRRRHAPLLRGGGARLLTVGRLVPNKGVDRLLAMLPRVLAARPDVRLLVVGDGPARTELEAQARGLGVAEHVEFLGERDDVFDLLALVDLFVTGTRYEGLGLAAAEALGQGVPVVGFRVAGVEEVVTDGSDGRLVPDGDVAAFADATLELLADPKRREAFGAAGRRSAARFDIARARERTEALYRALLRDQAP
jgi:glycosyltransferase involved in cell wall biosynthesis